MGVSFDAYAGNKVTAGTSNTWTHVVASNANLLVVFVDAGATVTGVTYNSVSMTQFTGSPVNYNSGTEHFSAWYLLNPSTGSHSVVATCGSSVFIVGQSLSFIGAASTNTFGTLATNSGTASGSSTNTVTTTSSNQLVVDAVNNVAAATDTPTASQTKQGQVSSSGTAAGTIAATGSNMTLTWSFTTSIWVQMSVAINPQLTFIYDGLSGVF